MGNLPAATPRGHASIDLSSNAQNTPGLMMALSSKLGQVGGMATAGWLCAAVLWLLSKFQERTMHLALSCSLHVLHASDRWWAGVPLLWVQYGLRRSRHCSASLMGAPGMWSTVLCPSGRVQCRFVRSLAAALWCWLNHDLGLAYVAVVPEQQRTAVLHDFLGCSRLPYVPSSDGLVCTVNTPQC